MKRLALFALSGLLACTGSSEPPPRDDCRTGLCDESSAFVCAAIRGNGEKIIAHFGALARITEMKEPVLAIAGGSSASITAFILESIEINERVYWCGDDYCPADEWKARIALLLKSFQAYAEVLAAELNPQAASEPLLGLLAAELANSESALPALLADDPTPEQVTAGMDALLTLVAQAKTEYPHLSLFNEDVETYLRGGPAAAEVSEEELAQLQLAFARDIIHGAQNLGAFETDAGMFLRPSVLDWDAFAELIGRAGNFYAGYGNLDFEAFLAGCASKSTGMTWTELSTKVKVGDGDAAVSCGDMFDELLSSHSASAGPSCGDDLSELSCAERENAECSRVDECVGEVLSALISTSLIDPGSYADAKVRYDRSGNGVIESNFDDVRFGYWGYPSDLTTTEREIRKLDDAKSAKFLSLGQSPWRQALSLSPAEPGLSPARPFTDGNDVDRVSTGGWSDLHPTKVLRASGLCDQIVYITREGEESGFAVEIAGLLGMEAGAPPVLPEGIEPRPVSRPTAYNLYSLDNPVSAYQLSVDEADAVWCTDWDHVDAFPFGPLFDHGYSAPMEARSDYFSDSDYDAEKVSSDLGVRGCSSYRE